MQHLLGTYATYFNRRYERPGHSERDALALGDGEHGCGRREVRVTVEVGADAVRRIARARLQVGYPAVQRRHHVRDRRDHRLGAIALRGRRLQSAELFHRFAHGPDAIEKWRRVEAALAAQSPTVPLVNQALVRLTAKRVGNYQSHPLWGPLLDQMWVQ